MEQKLFEDLLDKSVNLFAMPEINGIKNEYKSNIEEMKKLPFNSDKYKALLRRQFELNKRLRQRQ